MTLRHGLTLVVLAAWVCASACASSVDAGDAARASDAASADALLADRVDVLAARDALPASSDAPPDVDPSSISCATRPCPDGLVCIHQGFADRPDVCGEPRCWYRPATDGGPLTCAQAEGHLCRIDCLSVTERDVYCDCD